MQRSDYYEIKTSNKIQYALHDEINDLFVLIIIINICEYSIKTQNWKVNSQHVFYNISEHFSLVYNNNLC